MVDDNDRFDVFGRLTAPGEDELPGGVTVYPIEPLRGVIGMAVGSLGELNDDRRSSPPIA